MNSLTFHTLEWGLKLDGERKHVFRPEFSFYITLVVILLAGWMAWFIRSSQNYFTVVEHRKYNKLLASTFVNCLKNYKAVKLCTQFIVLLLYSYSNGSNWKSIGG